MNVRRLFFFALLFVLLILPAVLFAHGITFFEFAPDTEKSLNLSLAQTPSQPFYAANDFLDGIDLWVANTGAPGNVSFSIRDAVNTLLASKTVTVPTIPLAYSGTRLHVDFGTLVPITGALPYKIRIVTSLPNFYLYYANQFQILTHNAQSNPYYSVETALLGSTPQNFAFKYALSEGTESTPPVVSNVAATVIDAHTVRFSFNANEPVDVRADLTATNSGTLASSLYAGTYTICLPPGNPCTLTLTTSANTDYQYTLFVKDEWGNVASHTGSFTTPSDSNPPPGGGSPPPPPAPEPPPLPPPAPGPPPPAGGPPPPPAGGPPPPSGGPPPPANTPPPPATNTNSSGGSGNTLPPPSSGLPPPTGGPPPSNSSSESVAVSVAGNTISLTWTLPENSELPTEYRIQVRNENNELVQEFTASAETRKFVVARLGPGKYLVTVYLNRNGVLEQLGEPVPFTIGGNEVPNFFSNRKLYTVTFIVVSGIAVLTLIIHRMRIRKRPQILERSKSIFDKIKDTR